MDTKGRAYDVITFVSFVAFVSFVSFVSFVVNRNLGSVIL